MSDKELLQKIIDNQGQMLTDLSTLKNDFSALIAYLDEDEEATENESKNHD